MCFHAKDNAFEQLLHGNVTFLLTDLIFSLFKFVYSLRLHSLLNLKERIPGILLSFTYNAHLKFHNIHRESKKGATLDIAITLSILDRFAKFFHCCKER